MLVEEAGNIHNFIRERADPKLIIELEKAARAGNDEEYQKIKDELIKQYQEQNKIY